eukprot:Gb_16706 [translate_table: standard]
MVYSLVFPADNVTVACVMMHHLSYGQGFRMVGNTADLGNWQPSNGFQMTWHTGDVWTAFTGYGLTETIGIGTMLTGEVAKRYGLVGSIVSNMEAKLIDVDNDNPLPPNQKGEL